MSFFVYESLKMQISDLRLIKKISVYPSQAKKIGNKITFLISKFRLKVTVFDQVNSKNAINYISVKTGSRGWGWGS